MTTTIAVIGGGQAGAILSQELRNQGFTGEISLICADTELPYERPPLSKGILLGQEVVPVLPALFYSENGIDVRLGARAMRVERRESRIAIHLEAGGEIVADSVVLTTGSRPRRIDFPGCDLENVLTLGDLADARTIYSQVPTSKRVVIAGAGFIGTEVAASLRSHGCEVTLVEPFAEPLANKLGSWAAGVIRELHETKGVAFVQDVVAQAVGTTKIEGVITASGQSIPCDLLLVAAGSQPNLEVATASGIDCSDGVVCDAFGRTSMDGVWAAGDVASWPFGILGRLRVEHFRTAIDEAQVVARAIMGDETPSVLVPWFWTDQYDHRIEVAGRPDQGSHVIERTGPNGGTKISVHLRGGQVVGAIGLDAPREIRTATNLIRSGDPVDPLLIEDSSIDLRKVAVST